MSKDRLILVVDPSKAVRELLTKAFTLDGYRVEAYDRGIAALQKIYTGKVDVVLADAEMQDIEIDKFIKASQQKAPQIPIIVITANTSAEFEKQVRRNRIFFFTTKPFSLEILKTVISDALRYRKNQALWNAEELKHFRVVTRGLVIDALEVLGEIKRECQDQSGPDEILEGKGPATEGLPHCGWSELMEKLHLLEHYLDYAKRLSEGKI